MTATDESRPSDAGGPTFDAYVGDSWPGMVRACRLAGLDRATAEDVAQEALVVCYSRWSRIERMDNPDGYVYRVLVNGVRRHLRRRRTTVSLIEVEQAGPPGSDVESLDLLRNLPVDQRLVMVLRHYFGYSESQTAEILGMRLGTVKSKSSRAIARLRAELTPVKETR